MMNTSLNKRKIEHLDIIRQDPDTDRRQHFFDRIHLKHRALPEIDLESVDPSVNFEGKKLSFPLFISSMTGGAHERLTRINRNLARAAEATGVAMGVGSQRVMFMDEAARESFHLRPFAPNAVLFANIGAVQLNYGFTPDMCREAVEWLDADGLYLHLNPLQEAVQPEGDTNFSGLAAKIAAVVDAVDVPVLVKEVGAGISREDVQCLMDAGVRFIDVAGRGGTSWSRIEQQRRSTPHQLGYLFQDWGLPTPQALQMLQPYASCFEFIASGGVRNGLDMAKAMVLGASYCGMARPFIGPAEESAEAVMEMIEQRKEEFRIALFLTGSAGVADIKGRDDILLTTG